MHQTVSLSVSLCLLLACSTVSAQTRVWGDVYGNGSRGTFQRFTKGKQGDPGNDRVVIRVNGRFVGLKFWELMPDSQQFVKDKLDGDPDVERLEVTDIPREWKSRTGVSGTGQFLKVGKDGRIAIVIKSEKKLFDFEEFSESDQDYIRSLLSRTGQENLVPARATIADPSTNAAPGSPFSSTSEFQSLPTSSPVEQELPAVTFPASSAFSSTPFDGSEPFAASRSVPDPTTQPGSLTSFPEAAHHGSGNAAGENALPMSGLSAPTRVVVCSNCEKVVDSSSRSCPHCRAIFTYAEDEFGNRTEIEGSEQEILRRRWGWMVAKGAVLILVFIVVGLVRLFRGGG